MYTKILSFKYSYMTTKARQSMKPRKTKTEVKLRGGKRKVMKKLN